MEGPTPKTSRSADRLERMPPQNLEAEMSLLGSMIIDSEVIGEVLQVIGPQGKERFYRNDHRLLYEVLVSMYDNRQPVDIITCRDELQRRGALEEVGGVDYIVQLVESVPSAANAAYYARIVRDKAMLRDLIRASGEVMEMAYSESDEAREILDHAEHRIFDVVSQRVSGEAETLKTILKEVYERLRVRDVDYVSGLPTGFYKLDELTSGLQPGEMIVVAGRPSMGKTALGLNMASHVAVVENRPVAFFSMEQSSQQVVQRILCDRAGIDSHQLRTRRLSERDIMQLGLVCGELEHAPLFVDDTPGMTALELRSKTRRLFLKHKLSAVFVDYLQLMYSSGRAESRQQEVSEISRALKALARELDIPVVVMAQLNRQAEGREGHRPRMSDLRESGAIEQDADVILLLHREDYYRKDEPGYVPTNTAEVIVAKQRNGPTGRVELLWNERLTRFNNLSPMAEPFPSSRPTDIPAPSEAAPF